MTYADIQQHIVLYCLLKKKKNSLSEASLLVLDFTISVLGSSCNYLFLGLMLAP